MPLTLSVSFAKHVALPDSRSSGATCGITVELDSTTLRGNPAPILDGAREAFEACRRAVDDALSRHQQPRRDPEVVVDPGQAPRDQPGHGSEGRPAARAWVHRPATPSQHRALRAAADRRGVDLDDFLKARSHDGGVEALSIFEASRIIDALRTSGERFDS